MFIIRRAPLDPAICSEKSRPFLPSQRTVGGLGGGEEAPQLPSGFRRFWPFFGGRLPLKLPKQTQNSTLVSSLETQLFSFLLGRVPFKLNQPQNRCLFSVALFSQLKLNPPKKTKTLQGCGFLSFPLEIHWAEAHLPAAHGLEPHRGLPLRRPRQRGGPGAAAVARSGVGAEGLAGGGGRSSESRFVFFGFCLFFGKQGSRV